MKRTYPIKKGEYWNLLKKFITEFGYPTYYEELVIYFESADNFKITLTRDGLRWSWADDSTKRDKYTKSNHSIRTNLGDLKAKFLFLATNHGNKGHISIVPVLRFRDNAGRLQIEMRDKSLIGEIISVMNRETSSDDTQILDDFFKNYITPYFGGNLLEKTSRLKNDNEEFIHYNISESPILNTKILDFCRQNGIMNPFRKTSTYKDLLSSKSNNYRTYEELFLALTSKKLLETTEHCNLPDNPEKSVSIIIPCYNSENTINRLLRSIKHQCIGDKYFQNTEVIIIDDNSTNEVSKVINNADYPFRLEIIRLGNNHGVSHARELGVTHSTGDILIFVDSDVTLSAYYLADHIIRNTIINNAVFVSFKENVPHDDPRISENSIVSGVALPKYQHDLRIAKKVEKGAIGSYTVTESQQVNILQDTNFFKDFYGSRTFGVYDLSCMVTGHNFSLKKELVLQSSPFSQIFKGWGMEDVYFGLKMIGNGNYIIPVLSSGVFHIDHSPRSGSVEKKREEYTKNTQIINSLLESIVT